jgi:hypothetical protein
MASVDLPLRLVIVLEFLKTMYLFTTDFNCEAIANYFLCCERGDMAMHGTGAESGGTTGRPSRGYPSSR